MRSLPSLAASQKGSVSKSGVGRSNRMAVIGALRSAAAREDGDRDAGELGLAGLVRHRALEIDTVLAPLLVLLLHLHVRGEHLAGPRLLGEADLVVAQVADAHVVGQRLRQDA